MVASYLPNETADYIYIYTYIEEEDLSGALELCAQVVTNFLLLSVENIKKSHYLTF